MGQWRVTVVQYMTRTMNMNMTMSMVSWTILLVLSTVSMKTIQITRTRRAPQLIGGGVSGGVFRNRSSAVSGIMTFPSSAGNNLGGIPQPLGQLAQPVGGASQNVLKPVKRCRRVFNRRYRRYFRICD